MCVIELTLLRNTDFFFGNNVEFACGIIRLLSGYGPTYPQRISGAGGTRCQSAGLTGDHVATTLIPKGKTATTHQ